MAGISAPVDGVAQPLGTMYWRMAPYCNTLVLTVVQVGTVYGLRGYEDQCENAEQPTVEGTAIIQSGSGEVIVSLGLSNLHGRLVGVIENLSTLNGLWNDSYGNGQLIASQGVSRSSPFPRRPRRSPSFLHVVESTNRIGNISCFSHPKTDGNPEALIVFSRHRGQASAIGPQVDAIISLYYDDNGTICPASSATTSGASVETTTIRSRWGQGSPSTSCRGADRRPSPATGQAEPARSERDDPTRPHRGSPVGRDQVADNRIFPVRLRRSAAGPSQSARKDCRFAIRSGPCSVFARP